MSYKGVCMGYRDIVYLALIFLFVLLSVGMWILTDWQHERIIKHHHKIIDLKRRLHAHSFDIPERGELAAKPLSPELRKFLYQHGLAVINKEQSKYEEVGEW